MRITNRGWTVSAWGAIIFLIMLLATAGKIANL